MADILKRFVFGFEGREVTPFIRQKIQQGLFGIILFERNFDDFEGIRTLTAGLHKIRPDLVIAIDQEGGDKSRLRGKFPNHPSNRVMSRKYEPKTVEEAYYLAAVGLSELGIDWNLAPVVDLGLDGSYIEERTFSDHPSKVSEFAGYAIRGIQKAGLFTCAKHYAGLGGSKIDPHKKLPTYKGRMTPHLLPFLSAAIYGVDAIMTTHIICEEFSSEPVTVSEKALKVLRENEAQDRRISIGFDGVVITDDLLMGGATEWGSPEEVALRSLIVGHDIALICKDEDVQQGAIELATKELEKSDAFRMSHFRSLGRLKGMIG